MTGVLLLGVDRFIELTFILSKLFWLVFRPLNLTFLLLIAGLLLRSLGLQRKFVRRIGGLLLGVSVLMVVVFGFTNVPDYLLYQLENQAVIEDLPVEPAGIIVLGGGLNSRITRLRNIKIELSDGGDRLIVGFALANKYPDIPLVYSGGPATRTLLRDPETEVARNIAVALYGNDRNLIAENKSRNTWENAVFLKQLLKPKNEDKWIVVTSGYHALRTTGIFDSVGFNIVVKPTDYRAEYSGGFEFAGNALKQFKKADLALKELSGIVAYTLLGRIDWPFSRS